MSDKEKNEKALEMSVELIKATNGNEGVGLLLERLHQRILNILNENPSIEKAEER